MWDCGYCVAARWVPQGARYEKLMLNIMTLYLRFLHSLNACTSVGLLITFPRGLERTSYWRFNVHGQIGILTLEPCVFKLYSLNWKCYFTSSQQCLVMIDIRQIQVRVHSKFSYISPGGCLNRAKVLTCFLHSLYRFFTIISFLSPSQFLHLPLLRPNCWERAPHIWSFN